MTKPRIVVPGATTAITRRTTLRRATLGPWDPLVGEIQLYALAHAAQVCEVEVHNSVGVVTHHHTDVTATKKNLPEFLRRFHRDLSCGLQELMTARGYDVPGEVFDGRSTHVMRLVDAEAQASHLVYERLNCVAAGLVERPEDMPMRTISFDDWKRGYMDVARPPVYFGPKRPKVIRLALTPPPLLYLEFGGDMEALVYHMNRLTEDGIRALRDAREWPVMGAERLRRLDPWSGPRTPREPKGQRVPTFKIGARGIVGRSQRIAAAKEVHAFRQDHEEARVARRNGDFERLFPYGTYGMEVYHGAPVEDAPAEDAIVAAPGPTLAEVKAVLARERIDRDRVRERRHGIVDGVRAAWQDEAAEIIACSTLELGDLGGGGSARATKGDVVRDERKGDGADAPVLASCASEADGRGAVQHDVASEMRGDDARASTQRPDRRRMPRDPRGGGTHGSDPPG